MITGRLARLFPQVPCNYWCLSFGRELSLWRGKGQQLREPTEGSSHSQSEEMQATPCAPSKGLKLAGRLGMSLVILFILSYHMHTHSYTCTHSLSHTLSPQSLSVSSRAV